MGIVAYFEAYGGDWLAALGQHVAISLMAIAAAAAVGIPAGILAVRSQRAYRVLTGVFGTLRIIPSLAVLVACIPILGVGVKTALVALVFLAVPPVLINTALGFGGLPADVLTAAAGMGMGRARLFLTVKLPLALPLLLAGLRTATVEVISSATLAAYIGAGGLGTIIFTGIGLYKPVLLIVGGASVALLSILAGLLWGLAERRSRRWQQGPADTSKGKVTA